MKNLESIASKILLNGGHKEIRLRHLSRDISLVDDVCVGTFYRVSIANSESEWKGVGKTPESAVTNALGKIP